MKLFECLESASVEALKTKGRIELTQVTPRKNFHDGTIIISGEECILKMVGIKFSVPTEMFWNEFKKFDSNHTYNELLKHIWLINFGKKMTKQQTDKIVDNHWYNEEGGGIESAKLYWDGWNSFELLVRPKYNMNGVGEWTSTDTSNTGVTKPWTHIHFGRGVIPFYKKYELSPGLDMFFSRMEAAKYNVTESHS